MKIPIQIRLDDNGLLRKECPYCFTEYKIFPESETDEVKAKSYCPSCGLYASFNQQLTKDQVEFIEQEAMNAVIEQLNSSFKKMKNSTNNKNIKFNIKPLAKSDTKSIMEIPSLERVITQCCNETNFIEQPNTYNLIYCPICGEMLFPAN